ncbi:MAG: hypothetical protein A2651_02335 [Candidatus Yanofskybacteria bacterium RIFCSPHIGHO2_01_FULL_42_12]|uniref:Uncharacterized protein n=1 Tax=Candidatus Yanofskybacteria bacterium RIFCSPLOWO2_01_FULL_42_49 TaxID=1802694 RepID=A0A1F8GBN2_9BACT|nr:MAG: hypothetical protein A2651_02335 [Candidatus Yanofskybacteria bacterium RIFCSPHIGHO2_01_FULL_42_12]OGN22792.1 MAG: hypothetical protein A2918_01490 [Candidatus Yanofskybacteria bacterium RIFCSPLOWO2_01_FULL_42_49]
MLKAGQSLSNVNLPKIVVLKNTIYELLRHQSMTMQELTGCLMSEPYNISHNDLGLVLIAMNKLSEADTVRVSFRVKTDMLSVEAVFRAVPPPTVLDGFDF